MKRALLPFLSVLALLFSSFLQAQSINTTDTRLMHQPAIGTNHIAFIYANDLWVVDLNGNNPRRLTVDEGYESNPIFSPDGKTIAFSAEYDGNLDVFTVPVTGGIPKRLTYHPYPDIARDFTPDGKKVLFASQRNIFTNRYAQLFTVSTNGGPVSQLEIPNAWWASYSADGKYIAYTPISDRFTQWKHYRGGTASKIWVYDVATQEITKVPKPTSGSNDSQPNWLNGKVYFKSDRDGEFNIYSFDPATKQVSKHTNYTDHHVANLSANAGKLIYEQAGYLHQFNPSTQKSTKISVGIGTDLLQMRSRFVSGSEYVRSGGISPSGARVVLDFRGDIVTVPAEKGDVNNLTETTGTHEKFPAWSPDGAKIAYFSDESGEYALHVRSMGDAVSTKKIPLKGAGFYAYLHWSPDSKQVAYVDNSRTLYITNVDNAKTTQIASDVLYVPGVFRELFGSWSPDSKWLTYTNIIKTNFEQAYLFSVEKNQSYPISDGLSNVTEPTFDPSGKYVYMTASTDAGPVVNWFDQSNQDMRSTNSLYLVTLAKETPNPFARENDMEKPEEKAQNDEEDDKKNKKGKKDKKDKAPATPAIKVDVDGLMNRIVHIPVPPGNYGSLASPEEGKLYYLAYGNSFSEPPMLNRYDLKDRKNEDLFTTWAFEVAAKGKKMLVYRDDQWYVTDTGKKPDGKPLAVNSIKIKIDPKAEWTSIFNEAWRVNRDYFYDPGMHGVDWNAMKAKYQPMVNDAPTKEDLYRMMGWMFSELGVGHHRFGSRGDDFIETDNINGGLLGADYVIENNRYKIDKIYGGLNWNPGLRAPLTEPGVNVSEGMYIIKVDGKEVTGSDNLHEYFENKANRLVTLTISKSANGKDSKEVQVTPASSERALRNRAWIEGNIEKVNKATNGQVAYVYVPNTAYAGHEYFKRYFYPQANKKAIIIDERFNGGGQLADYVIDMLKKPVQSYWDFRYGDDMKAPSASIQGPKVMLIDETAGSGGDYLPWMFRKFELGTLVGKRTWGGLVGVLGYPEFIDGGSVTAPNVAFYTEEGFKVENEGVPPDVEVDQTPKDVIAGRDPQLEKAIEIALKELKENPVKPWPKPEYPDVTKQK
ncbi:S41 family peptidase [Gangjinia marincola]|uniref:Tricorn protease homolog n=1 Tax=Gangjinia marincola TaxID=578463 RepID=A0ABN1MIJ3_9FLAO